jgi:hypothetical protein
MLKIIRFYPGISAVFLLVATPASAELRAFHCAFDLDFTAYGETSTTPQNAMFIVDTGGRSVCIADDLRAGNAGGAVDVARLYDSLDAPGATARPYCEPGRRFGSFPNRARIERVSGSGITVSYRFLADGSGAVFDVALPSLAMTYGDPPGSPSGYSGRGRCRAKPLGPYFDY